MTKPRLSVVLPCLNESESLPALVRDIEARFPEAEIIVVDDGSCPPIKDAGRATVLRHPVTMGNGAAVKTGARNANGDYIVFMDADGQHLPSEIGKLLEQLESGFAMAVGSRQSRHHASFSRRMANSIYNCIATLMTGHRIVDLTSGFRAVLAKPFRNLMYLLPNGFSYPTTSTMAFLRSGYPISYVPVEVKQRSGKSKIKLLKDGIRFLVIILKIGTLFSPMRLFLPISFVLALTGISYYAYTFYFYHRFTNMSALLFISALIVFMIGILSEQISMLHYRYSEERRRQTDRRAD